MSRDPGMEELLRVVRARVRALVLAGLVASLAVGVMPAPSAAHAPGITTFMYAVGQVESNGRYDARNPTSGAYGKYQIMPANWPSWAARYLGDRTAPQTPRNQEIVARGKMHDLYHWLGSWRQVAHWWLTGRDGRGVAWSGVATHYVAKVMAIYNRRLGVAVAPVDPRTWVAETSADIVYAGAWASAAHAGYRGGRAAWSTEAGATATFTFTGSAATWYGPMGPTRGRAIVRVDGEVARVVDLHATRFLSRRALFTVIWPESGAHVIEIEVERVPGRPYIAIDAFAVTP